MLSLTHLKTSIIRRSENCTQEFAVTKSLPQRGKRMRRTKSYFPHQLYAQTIPISVGRGLVSRRNKRNNKIKR
ncbi:MAG: hypothetical protein PUA74_06410, partial [Clostridiales bacterium]|nr:hypothetical protein [Clostridiales bacterium]